MSAKCTNKSRRYCITKSKMFRISVANPIKTVKKLVTLALNVYFAFATDLMTISSYLPNRFVQVHDVLDGKVAHVEGEYVFAKSMQKLDVV